MDFQLDSYKGLAISIGITAFAHPALYVKTLIQIGHEPIAPKFTKGIIGANYYTYPHLFKYLGHIHDVDGFSGLYRGITPHLIGVMTKTYMAPCFKKVFSLAGLRFTQENALISGGAGAAAAASSGGNDAPSTSAATAKTAAKTPAKVNKPLSNEDANVDEAADDEDEDDDKEEEEEEEKSTAQLLGALASDTFLEVCIRSLTTACSHPFQVVMVRQMAEFVGGESTYSMGIGDCIREIYKTDGIKGFFSGIVPLLVSEVLLVCASNFTIFSFTNWVLPQVESIISFGDAFENQNNLKSQAPVIHVLSGLAFSSYLYKYKMISNVMIVKDSGLLAGRNLGMESCVSWYECLDTLVKEDQYKRGASLFMRTVPKSHLLAQGIV